MLFKTIKVDGLNVFYREAGQESAPKLVLLHGFPASSHQYRNLIPALADRFHVIAPDYPGFGNSDMPDPATFAYTFDKTSEIIEALLQRIGFTRFGLYVQDYGGPVGFRIVTRRPQWLQWLIIQNTNAYEVGFTPVWDGLRGAYWKNRTPETEKPLEAFLQADTVKLVYTHGHSKPELISPDNWNMICAISIDPMRGVFNSIFSTTTAPMSSFIRSGRRSFASSDPRRSFSGVRRTFSLRARAASPISRICRKPRCTD
jgi:pimeloyl-ACP methyl ester carboxylesterase